MQTAYKICLLIDDNYIDNFITRRVLESGNFAEEIIVRQSSTEAIEALRKGEVKPDVIFLDMRMPMMDGFEFLHEYDQLAEECKGAKIFMLTSSLDPADYRMSEENKYVTQFLYKPITPKMLEDISA